jgi:hypothetical protein
MLPVLRSFINAVSNLKSLHPSMPWWLATVLGVALCVPVTFLTRMILNKKFNTLSLRKRWAIVLTVILVAGVTLGSVFLPEPAKPHVLGSAPGRREQGTPTLNGCGGGPHYKQDDRGGRFELDSGACEAEVPDSGGERDVEAHAHAFGVLYYEVPASGAFPTAGFNIRDTGSAARRVRAQLYRPVSQGTEWCLSATTTNPSSPHVETVLGKDLGWSTTREDCWTESPGITSIKMRLDYDGMRLRVLVEVFRDAYRKAGKREDPQNIGRPIRAQYALPLANVSEIIAALGSTEENQPRWRLWLIREAWRLRLTGDEN